MSGPRKKSGSQGGHEQVAEQSTGQAGSSTSRAARMAQTLGNDELQKRIEQGSATRDELLTYMTNRLGAIREAQTREADFGNNHMREAWKEIADSHKTDITKPEPLRWHESARLYEMAAFQLCRGALGRGAQLMESAMEAERKAFEAVGAQTGARELGPDSEGCEVLDQVEPHQACTPRDVPDDLQRHADEIQKDNTEFKDQPVKRRIADPWWTLEEEEEEEEGAAVNGG